MLSISHIQLSINQSVLIFLFVPGLVSFCVVHSNAQINMLQGNKTWSIMYESMFSSSKWTHHYTFEEGHEINGVEYFRMLMSTDEAMTNWTATGSYAREGNNRVYLYTETEGEKLAYDFNLMTGDTFFISEPGFEDFLVVEAVDSVQLFSGEHRKQWTLTQPDVQSQGANELIWIEGIGSPFGEILSPWLTVLFTDQDGFLLCHKENEQILFSFYEEATCHIFTNLETIHKTDFPWSLHPNPASAFINVQLPAEIRYNEDIQIEISNAFGQRVFSGKYTTDKIDVCFLSAGLYMVQIKTEQGILQSKLFTKID